MDRDNDGIACEDLPHRPANNPQPPTNPPTPSPTVVRTVNFVDTLSRQPIVQILSNGSYSLSVQAFYTPIGPSTGTVSADVNGVTSLSASSFSFFEITPDVFASYHRQGAYASQGLGYRSGSPFSYTSLAGDFALMGRRCLQDTGDNCELVYGIARIEGDGRIGFCPQAAYSASCTSKISTAISPSPASTGKFALLPSFGVFGGVSASTRAQNGISLYMQVGSEVYSLFGQRLTQTVPHGSGSYQVTRLGSAGYAQQTIVVTGLMSDTPVAYFSMSPSGQVFLGKADGLLITGTPRTSTSSATLTFSRVE